MKLVTFAAQDLYLLDDPVDWSVPFRARVRAKSTIETGLTDHEGRRALASSLLFRVSAAVRASGLDARTLAAALRALQAEKVAVPLWPAACRWADRAGAEFFGGLNYVFRADGTASAVFEDVEPGWVAADDTLVPLVVGYLEDRNLSHFTDEFTVFSFSLQEDSPAAWAITPAAYVAPAGPQPAAYAVAPRLLPFPTHWDSPTTALTVRIDREEIGFGRELSTVSRDAAVARTVEQTAWTARGDGWSAGQLVRFFADHAGGKAFWTSGQGSAGRLHSDLPANATGLLLDGAEPYLAGDYIAALQGGRLVAGFGPLAEHGSAHFFKLVESSGALIAWSDGSIALAE